MTDAIRLVFDAYRKRLSFVTSRPAFREALERRDRNAPMTIHDSVQVSPSLRITFRQAWPWSRLTVGLRVREFKDASRGPVWGDDYTTTTGGCRRGELSGVPPARIARAVERLLDHADPEIARQRAVRDLDTLCKPYVGDSQFLDAVEKQEEQWGVSTYDSLTVQDCERWSRWVRAWAASR